MDWFVAAGVQRVPVSVNTRPNILHPLYPSSSFQPKEVICACSRTGHISALHVTKTPTHCLGRSSFCTDAALYFPLFL